MMSRASGKHINMNGVLGMYVLCKIHNTQHTQQLAHAQCIACSTMCVRYVHISNGLNLHLIASFRMLNVCHIILLVISVLLNIILHLPLKISDFLSTKEL